MEVKKTAIYKFNLTFSQPAKNIIERVGAKFGGKVTHEDNIIMD
jgi:hypothetical protein